MFVNPFTWSYSWGSDLRYCTQPAMSLRSAALLVVSYQMRIHARLA